MSARILFSSNLESFICVPVFENVADVIVRVLDIIGVMQAVAGNV